MDKEAIVDGAFKVKRNTIDLFCQIFDHHEFCSICLQEATAQRFRKTTP